MSLTIAGIVLTVIMGVIELALIGSIISGDLQKHFTKSEAGQAHANEGQYNPAPIGATQVDILHALINEYKAGDKKNTCWQKRHFALGVVTAGVVTIYTTIAALQWWAMYTANRQSADNFTASQRPYVSLGTKDGIVGYFDRNTDPVKIILYFHNGGNLPALRFNLFDVEPPNQKRQLPPQNMARVKMSNGGFMYIAGLQTINRDSDLSESWPTPIKLKDIEDADTHPDGMPLTLYGRFEYCDEFGEYTCRDFILSYRPRDKAGFSVNATSDCTYEYPNGGIPPSMGSYVPPCPSAAERQKQQEDIAKMMLAKQPTAATTK
jgi:hypothetical protein